MDALARKAGLLLVTAVLAVFLSGCVIISGTSTSQPQSMGPVRLTISACANGSPGCPGMTNTGSVYGFLDAANSDQTVPGQLLLAVRLPDGATPPDNLTAQISGGGTLAFARSSSYESELQGLEPAPAGERWWGWISPKIDYGRLTKQGYTVTIETTLPRAADGGPLPSPMHWRPVVGARNVDTMNLLASRPVDCGNTNADLYDGFTEGGGGGQPTTACVDSPAADATRGYLDAPIVDFGLYGTPLSAPAGSTVTATFLAKRSGAIDPSTTFSLAASGGAPGGSVTLDHPGISLGGDATTPVLATVVIPAGTPPGNYPITLTGTAAGKPTREATSMLTVPAPEPAPVAQTPTPTPTQQATKVAAAVSASWTVGKKTTKVKKLVVSSIPSGGAVEVRCSGKGCPFKRKTAKVAGGRADLKSLFKKRALRAGTVVEIRISAPGAIGKVVRYTLRKGKKPSAKTLCLPVGSSTPAAC